MPFLWRPLKKDLDNKKTVTLQVRIPFMLYGYSRKRVLSSASMDSRKGEDGRRQDCVGKQDCSRMRKAERLPSSLSVETALCLPLFLFALVILMMPMKMMDEGRKIQTELEVVCEEVSRYAYLLSDDDGDSSVPDELKGNLTKAGILVYADSKVKRHIDTGKAGKLSFIKSKVLEDDETIDLVLDYQMYLPFPVFRIKSIPMTARSCRRAWIGRPGGLENGNSGTEGKDELVYVGKNSTRYHRDKTCHYLYNHIEAVSFESIGTLRNAEGRKYRPCAICGAAASAGFVYVMPSGESYHSDRNCSSIIAYVRAVPLSEVEYLGACSYCSH